MRNLKTIIIDAIYGLCCNEPQSPSYITNFICENFIKAKYISPDELHFLIFEIDKTIKYLRQHHMLVNEYYMQDEFHFKTSTKFDKVLNYTFEGDETC